MTSERVEKESETHSRFIVKRHDRSGYVRLTRYMSRAVKEARQRSEATSREYFAGQEDFVARGIAGSEMAQKKIVIYARDWRTYSWRAKRVLTHK